MSIYFETLRFSFLRFLAYPFEILAAVLRIIVEISFLIFFWSLFVHSSNTTWDVRQFASYFLIAAGVNDLVMAQFGKYAGRLGEVIKTGTINNYLLKPIHILPTIYVDAFGKTGMNKILAFVTITVGILLYPPQSIVAVILFIIFFINAVCISFAFNTLEGTLFFHSPDARGIRNAFNHMVGIFSGLMIPLTLFPEPYRHSLLLTPFPWMIFGPVNSLKTNTISPEIVSQIGLVIFWSISLNLLAFWFWSWSVKKYEAIGI